MDVNSFFLIFDERIVDDNRLTRYLLGNTKVGKSIELQNISPVDDNKPKRNVSTGTRNALSWEQGGSKNITEKHV